MPQIGPTLREARQRRQMTLAEAEQATKIRSKYLQALEEEQFDLIPGEVFAKGFLRTYGDYLDVDGRRLVDAWNLTHGTRRDSEDIPVGLTHGRRSRRRLLLLAAGAMVVAAMVLGLLATDPDAPEATEPAPDPAPAVQDATPVEEPAEPEVAGAAVPAEPEPAPASGQGRSSGPGPLVVRTRGGESWIEVRRGDEVLMGGVLAEGETRRFDARNLVVVVGNPPAVELRRAGQVHRSDAAGPQTWTVAGGRIRQGAG